jgi:hypothetical protein
MKVWKRGDRVLRPPFIIQSKRGGYWRINEIHGNTATGINCREDGSAFTVQPKNQLVSIDDFSGVTAGKGTGRRSW